MTHPPTPRMNPGLFLEFHVSNHQPHRLDVGHNNGPYMPLESRPHTKGFFASFCYLSLICPRYDCREVFCYITQQPLFPVYLPSIAHADIPLRLYDKPPSKWLPELVLRHSTLFMTTSARTAQSARLLGLLLKSSALPAQMYKFCYSQMHFVSLPTDRSSAGRRNSVFTVSHAGVRRPTAFGAGKHGSSP
jgi:hypothetical protein